MFWLSFSTFVVDVNSTFLLCLSWFVSESHLQVREFMLLLTIVACKRVACLSEDINLDWNSLQPESL